MLVQILPPQPRLEGRAADTKSFCSRPMLGAFFALHNEEERNERDLFRRAGHRAGGLGLSARNQERERGLSVACGYAPDHQ
jgi:hypothetical protein